MATAKKTPQVAAKKNPKQKLYKNWTTDDDELEIILEAATIEEFELCVASTDGDEYVQLAVAVEQIDEVIKLLTTAKETLLRHQRGETVASDPLPEEDEEEELDEAEEEEEADEEQE